MPLRPAVSAAARQILKTAFDELDRTITPGDKRDFGKTTLQDVHKSALEIENQLGARQCLRNMRRLKPFFRGLEHYSKFIEILCNGTPYLPWIWAPVTLVLQITSEYVDAFDQIIKGYASIAESLKRFEILSEAFVGDPGFQTTVAVFYADILEFHKHTYKIVRRSGWKLMFVSSWGRFERKFNNIVEDLEQHGSLIDQEANEINRFGEENTLHGIRAIRAESQSQTDRRETKQGAEEFEAMSELLYTIDNGFAADMIDSAVETVPETTSPLCYLCTGLDISRSGFVAEYSLHYLRAGAGICKLCTLLFRAVENSQGPSPSASLPNTVSFYRNGSVLSLGIHGPVVLSLCAGPGISSSTSWKSLSDFQRGFPVLTESQSPERFSLLRRFLRYCDEHHSCMPEHTGFMPARLIDVKNLRLVTAGNLSPKERYAAFSWSRRVGWDILEALRTNLESEFDFASLPLTIRDAVVLTRSLDIRYLWIDSICTIKDEGESWKREVESMGSIFRNAHCTIAATSARDLSDGFLRPRPPRNSVSLRTPEGVAVSACEYIDDFQGDVDNAPLNKWAGTFRERVMSRRIIHFAENQFYWQCGDGIRCETLTKISRRFNFLLQDSKSPMPSLEEIGPGLHASQMLYEQFSSLELRWPSDRLEQIAEVEDFLAWEARTTAAFGLFDGDMARGLLWRRADIMPLAPISHSESFECPSWSWMAYSGRIVYMGVAKEGHGVHWADVRVRDSPCLRRDPPSRQLQISGARVAPEETVNVVYDVPGGHKERNTKTVMTGVVMATYELQEEARIYDCILVMAQSDQSGVWRRIGVGEAWRQADQIVDRPLVDFILE